MAVMARKEEFEVNPKCIFQLDKPELDQQEDTGEFYLKAIGVMSEKIPLGRQLLVAAGPTILSVLNGLTSGYSGILLPQLKEANSTIIISREEESWIAALAVLPMILGCILGGIIIELYGRKACMMFSCIPLTIGWLLFVFAKTTTLIFMGRFITGMLCGVVTPAITVYVGESTDPKYRGVLLAGLSFGQAFGVLWLHVMGTFMAWKVVAAVCAVVPVFCLIEMYYVPESPVWLAKKDRMYQAHMAFHWSRGNSIKVEKELGRMLDNSRRELENKTSLKEKIKHCFKSKFLKPFFVLSLYMTVSQWSGNNAITFYTVSIVEQTVGSEINEYLCMFIVDLVRLILSLLACYLVERMGRRPLTLVSGYASGISLLGLSLVQYLTTIDITIPPTISLLLLISFMGFVTVGLVPVPWALVGELFPQEMRGLGSGIISVVAFSMMFGVVKTGPYFFEVANPIITYIIYGLVCVGGTTILALTMPETKGKILQDIEDDFEKTSTTTNDLEEEHENDDILYI